MALPICPLEQAMGTVGRMRESLDCFFLDSEEPFIAVRGSRRRDGDPCVIFVDAAHVCDLLGLVGRRESCTMQSESMQRNRTAKARERAMASWIVAGKSSIGNARDPLPAQGSHEATSSSRRRLLEKRDLGSAD